MKHSAEMRRCLIEADVAQARKLWDYIAPHLPQPASDEETLATIHFARAQMGSIPFKLRAYSHRWLLDNSYPSPLPDHLKPKAERAYPRIVDAVGIACIARSSVTAPVVGYIRGAMSDSVLESYADNMREPTFVRARMLEARERVKQKLLGIFQGRSFISLSR